MVARGRPRTVPSLLPAGTDTLASWWLSGTAAVLVLATCVPAVVLNAAGADVAAPGGVVALPQWWPLLLVIATAALAASRPQHVSALVALLVMGACYLRVAQLGWWTLPLYVLAFHAVFTLLGLCAMGPRGTRFTRAALGAALRAAAPAQVGAQVLAAVVLVLALWHLPEGSALGPAAGIASACVLAAGAFAASRVARGGENPA
jgi:hypothetical protein